MKYESQLFHIHFLQVISLYTTYKNILFNNKNFTKFNKNFSNTIYLHNVSIYKYAVVISFLLYFIRENN